MPGAQKPTEVELRILHILWDLRSATARDVHNRLNASDGKNYSTTVKMLSVMRDKGLVRCDDSARPQTFSAAVTEQATQKLILKDLLSRVYEGASGSLVLHALAAGKPTQSDLEEIRRLIDQMESGPNAAAR